MHIGLSVLIDLFGVTSTEQHRADWWEQILEQAVEIGGLTKIAVASHQFDARIVPDSKNGDEVCRVDHGGATAFVLLSESHISVHTWPELGRVLVDILTCGTTMKVNDVVEFIKRVVPHSHVVVSEIVRGSDNE